MEHLKDKIYYKCLYVCLLKYEVCIRVFYLMVQKNIDLSGGL